MLTACGSSNADTKNDSTPTASKGLKVVASTSWVGAFAKAAGVTDVTVIAPANVQHPPDYDPKPSDLVAVAKADYVLYSNFDGFAAKIKEAAGGKAKLVPVDLENTPMKIRSEVTRLGAMFGTTSVAKTWLSTFDVEYAKLSADVKAKLPTSALTAVSQAFVGYWGDFAGVKVVGTFGPQPVTPKQLSELTAKKPTLLLVNAHLPDSPDIPGAKRVDIINFPGPDLDLLSVFRTNAEKLSAALAS